MKLLNIRSTECVCRNLYYLLKTQKSQKKLCATATVLFLENLARYDASFSQYLDWNRFDSEIKGLVPRSCAWFSLVQLLLFFFLVQFI